MKRVVTKSLCTYMIKMHLPSFSFYPSSAAILYPHIHMVLQQLGLMSPNIHPTVSYQVHWKARKSCRLFYWISGWKPEEDNKCVG